MRKGKWVALIGISGAFLSGAVAVSPTGGAEAWWRCAVSRFSWVGKEGEAGVQREAALGWVSLGLMPKRRDWKVTSVKNKSHRHMGRLTQPPLSQDGSHRHKKQSAPLQILKKKQN